VWTLKAAAAPPARTTGALQPSVLQPVTSLILSKGRGLDWPSRNAHRVPPCARIRPTWAFFDSVTKSFGAPVCAILVIGVVSMGGS
jgi:hypothetical protein